MSRGVGSPASAKADLLKNRADRLRDVRDGPFRPLDQEPVVHALLLLLGGTGTLTVVEFLFLGRGSRGTSAMRKNESGYLSILYRRHLGTHVPELT